MKINVGYMHYVTEIYYKEMFLYNNDEMKNYCICYITFYINN